MTGEFIQDRRPKREAPAIYLHLTIKETEVKRKLLENNKKDQQLRAVFQFNSITGICSWM